MKTGPQSKFASSKSKVSPTDLTDTLSRLRRMDNRNKTERGKMKPPGRDLPVMVVLPRHPSFNCALHLTLAESVRLREALLEAELKLITGQPKS